MVDTQKVGAFIAQCRKEHNWTQKELGEKMGVTDKAVSKWENGRQVFGVMAYFDRNLPGKNYRSSIIWLECIVEAFTLACIFGNSIISFWDIDNMTESIVFILIIAVIMLCLFATRIIAARTNREEYEMQKNADKHETEQ